MRKPSLVLICGLLLLLTNCKNHNPDTQNATNEEIPGLKSNTDLLQLFKEISIKKLHVWTVSDKVGGNKFKGITIDTSFFPLFGDFMTPYKVYSIDPGTGIKEYSGYNLYASYKFPINNYLTALILRVPSQYEESSVSIWIYNSKSGKLTQSIELADSFGDENWYFNKESWIEQRNNSICVITRQTDHEINETTSADSIISDHFIFHRFESEDFVEVDTIMINPIDYKLFEEK